MESIKNWSLQMFAEGGEGAAAPGTDDGGEQGVLPNTEGTPQQAQQSSTEPAAAQQKATFEDLMKDPDYKAAMDRRIRSAIANRFKGVNAEREAVMPLLLAVGEQYGIDISDPQKLDVGAIVKAYTEDESRLEQEAMEHGYSVENWKELKQARRIVQERQHEEQEAQSRQAWQQTMAESEQLKAIYPSFDLEAELLNPRFGKLLAGLQASGFSDAVRTAFESVHRDEIMGGAMQYAVQQTRQQIANSIQAGQKRPAENGAGAATDTKLDPRQLTAQQRKEIRQRVMRGEKITF